MNLLMLSLGFAFQALLCQARIRKDSLVSSTTNRGVIVGVNPNPNGESTTTGDVNILVNNLNTNAADSTPNRVTNTAVRELECGSTKQMYPGNTVRIYSTNFGVANYRNNEACTWKFEANQCKLSADCPCVDLPTSWECLGDYLKIRTDLFHYQRFCGGNKPGQPIYTESDSLSIRFRSDGSKTSAGFTCFVRCEREGSTTVPEAYNCPVISNAVP